MTKFRQLINPHSHSEASIDGAATIKQIVKRNKELGATHVCCTEHGNLNSAMDLFKTCGDQGVKPIVGIEFYLEPPFAEKLREFYSIVLPEDKEGSKAKMTRAEKIEKRVRESYVHLTVHFKDLAGYQYFTNLSPKMEQRAVVKFGERKPILTLEELAGAKGHITIGSGCLIGAVQRWLVPFKYSGKPVYDGYTYYDAALAERAYLMMREMAGKDDFFVEVFPHKVVKDWKPPERDKVTGGIITPGQFVDNECRPEFANGDLQESANRFLIEMAKKYGDKVIISLDSHFALPKQKLIQDARLGNGKDEWKFSNSYHVMSTDEAAEVLQQTLGVDDKTIEQWVDNSYDFASRFDGFKMETSKERWVMEPSPPDFMERLKAAIARYGRMRWDDKEMVERLQMELKILAFNPKINLLSYFFTIEDMANFCRENDILMNVRGSAGGSLLLYLLGVSAVNPLKHGLSFGRFLTEGRIKANTLPDVDMDVSTGGRDKLMEYLENKYGDRFCRISTDALLKLKSSIKDAERAILGLVRDETEALCKTLPNEPQGTNSRDLVFGVEKDGSHEPGLLETHAGLKAYADSNPEIWEMITEMLGIQRQKSIHACGVVIADRNVQEYCPIIYINETRVTGFSPKSIENAGLVKYDILGLNTLLDIQECLKSIRDSR